MFSIKLTCRTALLAGLALTSAVAVLSDRPARAADAPSIPPDFLPGPISANEAGFESLFDGKSLAGWDGDPALWRVENNTIVGEVGADATLKTESFLIWRGGEADDFELEADYRVSDLGNSGLQYRSIEPPGTKWALEGYQMDIDGRPWGERFYQRVLRKAGVDCHRITGQNVGKVILALPGQVSIVESQQSRHVTASFGSCAAVTQGLSDGWNQAHLIVRGELLLHIINGQVLSMVIDHDPARNRRGRIGLQLHPGGAMKVEFRNLRLKRLD